jgi:hypothetical protein
LYVEFELKPTFEILEMFEIYMIIKK